MTKFATFAAAIGLSASSALAGGYSQAGLIAYGSDADYVKLVVIADDGRTVMTEIFFPSEPFDTMAVWSEGGEARLISADLRRLREEAEREFHPDDWIDHRR